MHWKIPMHYFRKAFIGQFLRLLMGNRRSNFIFHLVFLFDSVRKGFVDAVGRGIHAIKKKPLRTPRLDLAAHLLK